MTFLEGLIRYDDSVYHNNVFCLILSLSLSSKVQEEGLLLATYAAAFDFLLSIAVLVVTFWVEASYLSLRMDVLGICP